MVQLIETGIETEKRGGETGKIGDPLPGEKIRWRARLRDAILPIILVALLAVGSIKAVILVTALTIGTIKDFNDLTSSERTHTSESPASAKRESSGFVSSGLELSSPSSNFNEADYNWERIKRIIDEFERARQARTLH